MESSFTATGSPVTASTRLPVCYGGGFGPDLEEVAGYGDLTPEEG